MKKGDDNKSWKILTKTHLKHQIWILKCQKQSNRKKKLIQKMLKSSPNQIRITGVFEQVLTPSKFEKFKLLKNTVPLDLIIQRKFDITEEKKFRYHYKSASNYFKIIKTLLLSSNVEMNNLENVMMLQTANWMIYATC